MDAKLSFVAEMNTKPFKAGADDVIKISDSMGKHIQAALSPKIKSQPDIFGANLNTKSLDALKTSFSAVSGFASNANNATKEFGSSLRKELSSEIDKIAKQDAPSFRYAMYDVANTLQHVSTISAGVGVAVLTMSAQYETAFTAIQRTTNTGASQLEFLKSQFMALSHEIPLAFGELTRIGSLGAQMGIADSELAGFTKTVAQFAATTNVSIDSAAQSFGALKNLLGIDAEGFNALGSAVAYVGINSVATETEVLSIAASIGGVAAQAGTSKEFVIGLSGALASLRIPAEQSRGALTRIFQEVNRAAAEGGPALQNFANILGMSADETKNLASTDMAGFFMKFNQGLSGMDAQQLTTALDSVALSDVRVTNVLARTSKQIDVLNKSMSDSAYGFANSGILAALYANKAEDLASRFQILISSLQELAAKLGNAVSPTFGAFIDWLTKRANDLSVALSTGAGKEIGKFAGIIGAATTVVFGLAGAIALATASLTAFNYVKDKLGITALTTSIRTMTGAWIANSIGISASSRALTVFKGALIATGIGAAIVLLGTLAASFTSVGADSDSASAAFSNMISDTSGLAAAMQKDKAAHDAAIASGNQAVLKSFVAVNDGIFANSAANTENAGKIRNTAIVLGMGTSVLDGQNTSLENNTYWLGANSRAWLKNQLIQNKSFQDIAGNADFMNYFTAVGANMDDVINAAAVNGQQGVIDYFNKIELTGVGAAAIAAGNISSAFAGNMFGGNETRNLKTGLFAGVANNIGDLAKPMAGWAGALKLAGGETKKAATETEKYNGSLSGLGNTAKKVIYLLTDYANDLSTIFGRAFDIRFTGQESLDKVTSSISKMAKATADARQEITDLQADISQLTADKALQEYFLTVANAYGDALSAAQIGANLSKINTDLAKKNVALQKAQDATNKTLVGNSDAAIQNRSDILGLVKSYQDHIKTLAASGIGQDALASTTEQLRQDFINQATQIGYNVDELGFYATAFGDVKASIDNVPRNLTVDFNGDAALTAVQEFAVKAKESLNSVNNSGVITPQVNTQPAIASIQSLGSKFLSYLSLQSRASSITNSLSSIGILSSAGRASLESQLSTIKNQFLTGNFASGGYTGAGGKYDVAGIVHRGEYVVPKEQVNQSTGMPYYMQQPRAFATGGYTGGNATEMMVSLSPEDRAILRNAGGSGNIVLYADNRELARSVNDGNRQIVASGGRP